MERCCHCSKMLKLFLLIGEQDEGFFKSLKKCCKPTQIDPLGEANRDGEFSLYSYYSVFEAVLETRPGNALQMTQRIIAAKFNLLSRCELD